MRIIFVVVLSFIGTALVHDQIHHHGDDTLGVVNFPISCQPASQSEFNRAMTLLHHMTYPQAREAFQKIAELDSGCAMAYWGIAMTMFQPVWPTRPGPRELHQGWDAIQKAESLSPPTERERLLISATEAFFGEPDSSDYWKRIQAWNEGMEKAYAAFPRDNEISALYALALVATIPSDQVTSPNNARASEILLQISRRIPTTPEQCTI
jgi:hypothetical protein